MTEFTFLGDLSLQATRRHLYSEVNGAHSCSHAKDSAPTRLPTATEYRYRATVRPL